MPRLRVGSDSKTSPKPRRRAIHLPGPLNLRIVILFALLTFLEVGIENTTGSWLATYALRTTGSGVSLAAASTSFYWAGFLASRGLSSLLLLRVDPKSLLRLAIVAAFVAAIVLVGLPGTADHAVAMVVLGAALAPIFPLLLARFFATRSKFVRFAMGPRGLRIWRFGPAMAHRMGFGSIRQSAAGADHSPRRPSPHPVSSSADRREAIRRYRRINQGRNSKGSRLQLPSHVLSLRPCLPLAF